MSCRPAPCCYPPFIEDINIKAYEEDDEWKKLFREDDGYNYALKLNEELEMSKSKDQSKKDKKNMKEKKEKKEKKERGIRMVIA